MQNMEEENEVGRHVRILTRPIPIRPRRGDHPSHAFRCRIIPVLPSVHHSDPRFTRRAIRVPSSPPARANPCNGRERILRCTSSGSGTSGDQGPPIDGRMGRWHVLRLSHCFDQSNSPKKSSGRRAGVWSPPSIEAASSGTTEGRIGVPSSDRQGWHWQRVQALVTRPRSREVSSRGE